MEKRIGMLGAGNIAGALIRGMLSANTVEAANLRASDVREDRLTQLRDEHGIDVTTDNDALAEWADVVVLGLKPQVIEKVLGTTGPRIDRETLVISVAAGVPLEAIETAIGSHARVIRAMPNTAAIALAGATAIAAGKHASEQDVATAKQLFDAVGRTVVLDESLIDAVTGLSGSGPAYVMLIIEALADGGVKVGLPRDTALLLAAQTVYGSAKLLLDTGEHPGRLKDMVTSPGGTTIAGLHSLESGGLRRTLIDAVESATRRAVELGEAAQKKRA